MSTLVFDDAQGYADFATFVARARSLDDGGAMRLQADGDVLAAYVGVLPGRGLLGDGAVVGLRVVHMTAPVHLDTTVALASLTDRLARRPLSTEDGTASGKPGSYAGTASGPVALEVPTATVQAAWAALTPPRSGWEPVGTLTAQEVEAAARAGIEEVATGAPPGSGAHAVTDLRHRVWGRLTTTQPPVPAGAAFAAYRLGFLDPAVPCRVAAHGRWTRLSSPRGHALVR